MFDFNQTLIFCRSISAGLQPAFISNAKPNETDAEVSFPAQFGSFFSFAKLIKLKEFEVWFIEQKKKALIKQR